MKPRLLLLILILITAGCLFAADAEIGAQEETLRKDANTYIFSRADEVYDDCVKKASQGSLLRDTDEGFLYFKNTYKIGTPWKTILSAYENQMAFVHYLENAIRDYDLTRILGIQPRNGE